MAHSKQAQKRVRTNDKARLRNKTTRSKRPVGDQGGQARRHPEESKAAQSKAAQALDKAAKKGRDPQERRRAPQEPHGQGRQRGRRQLIARPRTTPRPLPLLPAPMGSFETSADHSDPHLKPLHVALRREILYGEALTMAEDLDGWTVLSKDEEGLVIECERKGGLMGGSSRITLRVEGPEGLPSATLHIRSESQGGLLKRDKANVAEFMRPFNRRVG